MLGLTAIQFFISIFIVFALLYWIIPREYAWISFVVTLFLLCLLAYKATPNPTDDLTRYFHYISWMRDGGKDVLDGLIEEDILDWKTFRVTAYLCYFVSKTNSNYWLPVITIFIVYGGAFLVIYKAANRLNSGKFSLFIASMLFLSTYWYYDVYSGTRNGIAFSIAVTSAYFHLFERKYLPICYLGYLIACFTHSGGIVPVALALLAAFTFNTSGRFLNNALIFGVIGGGALLPYVASITNIEFFDKVGERAADHSSRGFINVTDTSTMYSVNVTFTFFTLIIISYYSYYLLGLDHSSELKRFYKFSSLCIYFSLGCAFTSGLLFVRFARFILPVIIAVIFVLGHTIQLDQIESEGYTKLVYYSNKSASFRFRINKFVLVFVIFYIVVHFWYLCVGSSMQWITFDYVEFIE